MLLKIRSSELLQSLFYFVDEAKTMSDKFL